MSGAGGGGPTQDGSKGATSNTDSSSRGTQPVVRPVLPAPGVRGVGLRTPPPTSASARTDAWAEEVAKTRARQLAAETGDGGEGKAGDGENPKSSDEEGDGASHSPSKTGTASNTSLPKQPGDSHQGGQSDAESDDTARDEPASQAPVRSNITGPSGSGTMFLPLTVMRNLGDRLYDKRKLAALELEPIIRQLAAEGNHDAIEGILRTIDEEFLMSASANARKGGLIGLAACGLGLTESSNRHVPGVLVPVLRKFSDYDGRVRYYACESLYNVAKVYRNSCLEVFNDIFDGLCKLAADPDLNVQKGASLVDRLLKDVVTESESFEIETFIPLLKERIMAQNPYTRAFLVGWISALDSVPDIDLLEYLPEFLMGLFQMLGDANKDIRDQADSALAEFLREIKQATVVNYGPLVRILQKECESDELFIKVTAITWVHEFIALAKENLLPFCSSLLAAILPSISHEEDEIRTAAVKTNRDMLLLVHNTDKEFDLEPILQQVTAELASLNIPTQLAALQWILMLLTKTPDTLLAKIDEVFMPLMNILNNLDEAVEVVTAALEVLARISHCDQRHFKKFISTMVKLFSSGGKLLEIRGTLIIRNLSVLLNPEKIYREIAQILQSEEDLHFASLMIQTVNLILLTAPELADLRHILRQGLGNDESRDLFLALYPSWCHNPVSTFSLCLFAQAYEHACALVNKFAEVEVTLPFLVQLDKLVQLIESKIFCHLRLQLLEPKKYPYLLKALYGLLMLLPQSTAFKSLKNRLKSVSAIGLVSHTKDQKGPSKSSIDLDKLLQIYQNVSRHHQNDEKSRKESQAQSLLNRNPLDDHQTSITAQARLFSVSDQTNVMNPEVSFSTLTQS